MNLLPRTRKPHCLEGSQLRQQQAACWPSPQSSCRQRNAKRSIPAVKPVFTHYALSRGAIILLRNMTHWHATANKIS